MKPGKTELRLNADIEKRGALFAVLLDPDTSDETAFVKAGAMAAENGADLLLVGGSYLGNFTLPKQVAALKAHVDLPVVLFPGGASQVVPGFDAMLFMTLVSGRNPNYLIDEQVRGGALGVEKRIFYETRKNRTPPECRNREARGAVCSTTGPRYF